MTWRRAKVRDFWNNHFNILNCWRIINKVLGVGLNSGRSYGQTVFLCMTLYLKYYSINNHRRSWAGFIHFTLFLCGWGGWGWKMTRQSHTSQFEQPSGPNCVRIARFHCIFKSLNSASISTKCKHYRKSASSTCQRMVTDIRYLQNTRTYSICREWSKTTIQDILVEY